jgi:glycine/D-amino acid oxidase-like deaminating enzyme
VSKCYSLTSTRHAPSPHTRVEGGALLHRGFMLEPRETCRHLTRHVDDIFELTPVTHLTHRDGDWLVNEQYLTRHVILCTAHDTALVDQPWLKNYLRPVYGDVLEVSTSSHVPHTISGGTPNVFISPSSFLGNGHVLIGATHIQPNEQRQFDLHDTRLEELLSHAQTIHPLKDARVSVQCARKLLYPHAACRLLVCAAEFEPRRKIIILSRASRADTIISTANDTHSQHRSLFGH